MGHIDIESATSTSWPAPRQDHDTASPRTRPCTHRLFEAQVERSPDATALRSWEGDWSYRELNRRSNQVAHHLRALGVIPDDLVGLCLPRSLDMVAALLGVLKAGGAYVPLDPAYPRERLAYMLDDSRVPILLSSRSVRDRLPGYTAATVFLDADWPEIARQPSGNPAGGATPDDLAYVIYTSGSTGRPKGAMILHRGLSNYLLWALGAYPVAAGQGAPVHSSISFDLTVTSLLAPLLAGRRVDLLDDDLGIDQLATALRDNADYSLVKITPAHLQLLGRQLASREAAGRTRAFVIGGEQLTAEHIAFWQEHAPDTLLFNEYGPTETVVGCCVYQVPRGVPAAGVVPIGSPIDNTQLCILDEKMNRLPEGVVGELYIGGAGVARGYLNQPEPTARKFVDDPFGRAGAKVYRSGDLCRRRADGALEFVGRADHQVKIRGYRVEPGEVETALLRHPGVEEAVVVRRDDATGAGQLVAYVVTTRGRPAPSVTELRMFLRELLPEPMIPAAVVALDAMPLSVTGKVDRTALPAPDRAFHDVGRTVVEPSTPYEHRLRALWEEALGVTPIGVEDDFLKLGGNSLRTTALLVRIEKEFGKSVSPSVLLRGGTIRQLAEAIAGTRPRPEALAVRMRDGSGRPLFLLPGIGGIPEELADLVTHFPAERPIYSFRAPGLDGTGEAIDRVEPLATRYLEMLRSVQPAGPYLLAGYSFGGTVAFEMARQLHDAGERIDYLAIIDKDAPGEFARPWWNPAYTASVASRFGGWAAGGLLRPGRARHARAVAQGLTMFFGLWKNYLLRRVGLGIRNPSLHPEITQAAELPAPLARVIARNLRADLRYRPRKYPGRLILYRTRTPAPRFRPTRLDIGWGLYVTHDVDVRFLEAGDHLTLLKGPTARVLAGRIETDLAALAWGRSD